VLFNEKYRATVQLEAGPYASQELLLHVPFRAQIALTAKKGKRVAPRDGAGHSDARAAWPDRDCSAAHEDRALAAT